MENQAKMARVRVVLPVWGAAQRTISRTKGRTAASMMPARCGVTAMDMRAPSKGPVGTTIWRSAHFDGASRLRRRSTARSAGDQANR